jgi:menaquinone-specific isochorismate synthase
MTPTSQVTGASLVARTVALDGVVDLADVAGDDGVLFESADGVGLAGRGVAARVKVCLGDGSASEEVSTQLGAIGFDGTRPPLAIGALPFSRSEHGEMVVPAILVRREADGSFWLTVTASEPGPALEDALENIRRRVVSGRPDADGSGPDEYLVRSTMQRDVWCGLVADAARTVAAGDLAKVVLAREVTVSADRTIRPTTVARRLRFSHSSCIVFSVDGFVGASPELLVERNAEYVRSQPLAGTAARPVSAGWDDDPSARLLSSTKEREEHAVVVDAVSAALSLYCDELSVPAVPALVPIGTLAHLGSSIVGRLRHPLPTALDLVEAIHPSPAVGGTPTDKALDYIAAVESLDRGRYGGPVGWVDAHGDGCWAIGIRSAQIEGSSARLMAGVGVVARSDPEAELAETELKFEPMLDAIVRP